MQRISLTHKLTLLAALFTAAPVAILVHGQSTQENSGLWLSQIQKCQQLALDSASLLERHNFDAIRAELEALAEETDAIKAVRLLRFDGLQIHDSSRGQVSWKMAQDNTSQDNTSQNNTSRLIQFPIVQDSKNWGQLEVLFSSHSNFQDGWLVSRAFGFLFLFNVLAIGLMFHRSRFVRVTDATRSDITTLDSQKQILMLAMAELQKSKEQIQQQNVRLQELASKDVLTSCFNRRKLMEYLESSWLEHLRMGTSVNVVMLDVDHFKKLNDNFGHAIGDEVLTDAAKILQASVEESGIVGRYGGEEFCIVLPNMPVTLAVEISEGVRRIIQHEFAEPYGVTVSLGVSSTHCGVSSCQSLLEQADHALYASKKGGRNQVTLWSNEMQGESRGAKGTRSNTGLAVVQNSVSYQAVTALHSALAYRDADTALHSQRVSELCVNLGRGQMSISELYLLEIAGLLHDIGKIGVPDRVLLKPGRLDQDQWAIMEAHSQMGLEIVESTFQCSDLSDVVGCHHLRFDGTGTPEGRPVGKDLPLGARIIAIVDAYDAMVSNRVYRKGRTPEEALLELQRCAGTQFDPDLVERFVALGVGWRPDSRYPQIDVEYSLAISVGHLTERTVLAFEAHDVKTLAESLDRLKCVARQLENAAIMRLADELSNNIAGRDVDWENIMPTLQCLLDMCLTIQRAHIREVGARPQATLNCPQKAYYKQAREWEVETIQGGSGI